MGLFDGLEAKREEKKEAKEKAKELKVHEKYMKQALKEAEKAKAINEVPIGCVIVKDGKVIAKGYNRRNTDKNVLAHAELTAIQAACKKTKDWRLEDCTIYITLEPCQMCAGAIVQARIPKCVVGSMNPKAGCAGSVINLLDIKEFNHQVEVVTGVLEDECSELLSGFFRDLREEKKEAKQETPLVRDAEEDEEEDTEDQSIESDEESEEDEEASNTEETDEEE